jgi:hypothetical protein
LNVLGRIWYTIPVVITLRKLFLVGESIVLEIEKKHIESTVWRLLVWAACPKSEKVSAGARKVKMA